MANSAGVSKGALRKWAQGTSDPIRDRLVAIARAAKVNLAWLATGNALRDRSSKEDMSILVGFF